MSFEPQPFILDTRANRNRLADTAMVVYTDSPDYADRLISPGIWRRLTDSSAAAPEVRVLAERLFGPGPVLEAARPSDSAWEYLFAVESALRSQFDVLVALCREGIGLPDGVLCVAGEGRQFHGLRDRPWSAPGGNVYLSVHFAPSRRVAKFGIGSVVLAAVSVLEAIDRVPGLANRAGIKWVNDILIDGAKVCGVLGYTQGAPDAVTAAVIGIGLNVETTPAVEPTPFVPRVRSLRDFSPDPRTCTQRALFEGLIEALGRNYRGLMERGFGELAVRYRERSVVLGRDVAVCAEECGSSPKVVAVGKATGFGENMELLIEGCDKGFPRGRLILDPDAIAHLPNSRDGL